MIPLDDFQKLRLRDFVTDDDGVVDLANWVFLDRTWLGEAIGFSEWLRPEDDPERLVTLALELDVLRRALVDAVLSRIGLDVRPADTAPALARKLGPPVDTQALVPDRTTYIHVVGDERQYEVSCTVLHDGGLTYVVVAPRGTGL
jgi:hypothetical protein